MATVINNPGNGSGAGSSVGVIVGVIVLLVVLALFFVYALPAIRGSGGGVPNAIDLNVNLPENVTAPTQ